MCEIVKFGDTISLTQSHHPLSWPTEDLSKFVF
jgi:hypothetical protein